MESAVWQLVRKWKRTGLWGSARAQLRLACFARWSSSGCLVALPFLVPATRFRKVPESAGYLRRPTRVLSIRQNESPKLRLR